MENEHWQAGPFPMETPGPTEWREELRILTTFGEQALQEERKKSGGKLAPVSPDAGARLGVGLTHIRTQLPRSEERVQKVSAALRGGGRKASGLS